MADRIAELIRQHADPAERDELLASWAFADDMAGAALAFVCSDDGEDADGDGLDDMRALAIENGGDVGEQHCTITAAECEHHDHDEEARAC